MKKYKDKCDICGVFDYLRSVDGKCLCEKCRRKIEKEKK